jgi:hypothetical protein
MLWLKYFFIARNVKHLLKTRKTPRPWFKKKLIEEGVETWIDTKLCLECSEEK